MNQGEQIENQMPYKLVRSIRDASNYNYSKFSWDAVNQSIVKHYRYLISHHHRDILEAKNLGSFPSLRFF